MALKFKSVEKAQPGVAGGGVKKNYAAIVTDGELTIDGLVTEIEKFSALSEPDIRGVIVAIENVIQNKLADGKIIRLEKLGAFYPTLSSNGEEKPENVTSRSIKSVGVNYSPGTRILAAMQNAGFKKVQ